MKKFLVFVALFVFGLTSVSAMTESELKAKLSEEQVINGATFKASDEEKNLIDMYLSQFDITSTDADKIVDAMTYVFNVLKNSGKQRFQDLSSAQKQDITTKIRSLSQEVSSINVDVVNGKFVVYNPNDGSTFYQSKVTPIATTNRSVILAGLGLISVVGLALAFKKVKNA